MNCDRTQISGLAARAHNAQARIGGCRHTSGTKRGEKSKSPDTHSLRMRLIYWHSGNSVIL